MNNRLYLYFAALWSLAMIPSYYALAQDEKDALRYSYLSTQGTARSIGIGGALGSIGGDFSSLSVNPAGIGVYRSSEFMLTPAIRINNASGVYTDKNSMEDNATQFTFGNIGVVLTNAPSGRRYERSKWKAISFGFGINRVADFNRNYIYKGFNNTSSGSETFAYNANQNNNAVFDYESASLGRVGYLGYLLGEDSLGFYSIVDFNAGLNQQRVVKEKGGISEIVVSLGGNYQEKLLLGATLGIQSLRYHREATFTETDASGLNNNYFDNFIYNENLTTKGSGINLKLGFIYKPDDNFRIGFAFHTPTFFGLSDEQTQSISSNTENFKTYLNDPDPSPNTTILSSDLPVNVFDYSLVTPWRTVISGSAIIGKIGFITADYEYVDYASARFRYPTSYQQMESDLNNIIRNTYQGGHNIRIGGEAKLDFLMFRLGFGFYSSPYRAYNDANRYDISAGMGMRFDSWFLDLGFINSHYNNQEQPYNLDVINVMVPRATVTNSLNTLALTLGFKF